MKISAEQMTLAIRVLNALTDRHDPDPVDVLKLKSINPSLTDMPLDELACEVIQQALKRRAEVRNRERATTA